MTIASLNFNKFSIITKIVSKNYLNKALIKNSLEWIRISSKINLNQSFIWPKTSKNLSLVLTSIKKLKNFNDPIFPKRKLLVITQLKLMIFAQVISIKLELPLEESKVNNFLKRSLELLTNIVSTRNPSSQIWKM